MTGSSRSSISKTDTRPQILLGEHGEEIACRYLQNKGMTLICRNWRCRLGEIDAVFFDDRDLVFVEVKSRYRPRRRGISVFDNVDHRKQQKLRSLVDLYLSAHYRLLKPPPVRIDLVGVLFDPHTEEPSSIEHLVAAV